MTYIKFNSTNEDILDIDNFIAYYANDMDDENNTCYTIYCLPKIHNEYIALYYEDIETRDADYVKLQKYIKNNLELIDFSENNNC